MNLKLAVESADGKLVRSTKLDCFADQHSEWDVYASFDREEKIHEALEKLTAEVTKFPVKNPSVELLHMEEQDKTSWYALFSVRFSA